MPGALEAAHEPRLTRYEPRAAARERRLAGVRQARVLVPVPAPGAGADAVTDAGAAAVRALRLAGAGISVRLGLGVLLVVELEWWSQGRVLRVGTAAHASHDLCARRAQSMLRVPNATSRPRTTSCILLKEHQLIRKPIVHVYIVRALASHQTYGLKRLNPFHSPKFFLSHCKIFTFDQCCPTG